MESEIITARREAHRNNLAKCYMSCGCVVLFHSRPSVGDELYCVRCDSPVRAIKRPTVRVDEVA